MVFLRIPLNPKYYVRGIFGSFSNHLLFYGLTGYPYDGSLSKAAVFLKLPTASVALCEYISNMCKFGASAV